MGLPSGAPVLYPGVDLLEDIEVAVLLEQYRVQPDLDASELDQIMMEDAFPAAKAVPTSPPSSCLSLSARSKKIYKKRHSPTWNHKKN